MPRKDRIDAPGALRHIIIGGIERKDIFRDDHDKEEFISKAVIRGQEIVRDNDLEAVLLEIES